MPLFRLSFRPPLIAALIAEALLTKVRKRPHLNTTVLGQLSPTSAVVSLDYKVADLTKRLNKMKFRIKGKGEYLDRLNAELKKIEKECRKQGKTSKEEVKLRYFENEIHKTTLKGAEAEMVKKKFEGILDIVYKEHVNYNRRINLLENHIKEQLQEIASIRKEYGEAVIFRNELKVELKEWEGIYLLEFKERNNKIMAIKTELKEKKEIFITLDNILSEGGKPKITTEERPETPLPDITADSPKEGEEEKTETKTSTLWPSARVSVAELGQ